jgi:hypothetical protein
MACILFRREASLVLIIWTTAESQYNTSSTPGAW